MSLTWRAAALAAIGVVVVFVKPLGGLMVAYVAAVIVVAAVLDVVFATSPRAVGLHRDELGSCRLGDTVASAVTVANPGGRRMRGWLRDAWPPSAQAAPRAARLDIPAGDRRRTSTVLVPERRGEIRSTGVTLRIEGPLGVAARQRHRALPGAVRVLPSFASRKFLPEKLARLRQLDGQVTANVRGQGTEFDSLREYVAGDDVRAIDWRATARRGDVVVRTWRPERDRQLLLVIDSGRTSAARVAGYPRLDTVIDATLLLTALAQRAGDRVAVLVHDQRLRAAVDVGRGAAGLAAVVNVTAPVEPLLVETDMHAVVAECLRRLRRRSLVVIFTSIEPEAARSGLLPALGPLVRRHAVVVASVADDAVEQMAHGRGDAERVYAAAAAESAIDEQLMLASTLRRKGVEVVVAPSQTFPSVVADAYLELKAAGRL